MKREDVCHGLALLSVLVATLWTRAGFTDSQGVVIVGLLCLAGLLALYARALRRRRKNGRTSKGAGRSSRQEL